MRVWTKRYLDGQRAVRAAVLASDDQDVISNAKYNKTYRVICLPSSDDSDSAARYAIQVPVGESALPPPKSFAHNILQSALHNAARLGMRDGSGKALRRRVRDVIAYCFAKLVAALLLI